MPLVQYRNRAVPLFRGVALFYEISLPHMPPAIAQRERRQKRRKGYQNGSCSSNPWRNTRVINPERSSSSWTKVQLTCRMKGPLWIIADIAVYLSDVGFSSKKRTPH